MKIRIVVNYIKMTPNKNGDGLTYRKLNTRMLKYLATKSQMCEEFLLQLANITYNDK